MCACTIRHRCFSFLFGLLLLPTWIIVIVLGGAGLYMSSSGKDEIIETCYEVQQRLNSGLFSSANAGTAFNDVSRDECNILYDSDIGVNLNVYEKILIDQEMCSSNCPCK